MHGLPDCWTNLPSVPVTAVGLSHHLATPEDLAQISERADPLEGLIAASPAVDGWVLLSTCNRFELYLDGPSFHELVSATLAAVRKVLPVEGRDLADQFEVYVGQSAVEHLLEVASGLDSMVVGEAEVIGQVRAAIGAAGEHATSSLHRLFHAALTTGKAVASETDLGAAGRSVAGVGLDLVEQRHFSLAGRRALVVGTGSYARVVTAALVRRGCVDISVYSSTGRADAFAESHPVVPVDDLAQAVREAELVVTCSGSSAETMIGRDLIEAARDDRPLLPILDLSLSGDVDPAAADLLGVDLIDLEEIGAHAPSDHGSAVLEARDLVSRGVETYLHLESGRVATPAVTAMRAHVSQFIEKEIEVARRRYDPETAEAVARSLRRVSNSLLHAPSLRAAELARTGALADYQQALHTLFGIDIEVQG
jgi:glutamyl-tRNA reductase